MQSNNPFTEIGAIVIAVVLIAGGVVLLVLKDIDPAYATSLFILAVSLFAGNLALKTPSAAQQTQLAALTAQALQAQAQPQLVQAPVPVATPQAVQMPFNPAASGTASVPPQFVQPAGMIIPPAGIAMPQAIMTTQTSIPTVKPQ